MNEQPQLTIVERAILANQYRILSIIDPKSSEAHSLYAIIFEKGSSNMYQHALKQILPQEENN